MAKKTAADRARESLGIQSPRSDGRWVGEVRACTVCGEPSPFGGHCPPKKRK